MPGTYRGTSTGGQSGMYTGVDTQGAGRHHFYLRNVADTYFGKSDPWTPNLLNGTWGSGAGTGPFAITFTVTDSVSLAAIQNATVTLSRTGETATALTNASGVVVLYVTAATFTRTVAANGYATAGASQVVTIASSVDLSLSSFSITPSASPETTGYGRIRYAGAAVEGAVVEVEITRWANGTTGVGITPRLYRTITNASGDFQVVGLPRLSTYRVRVDAGEWTLAAVTLDAATTPLLAPLGPLV